jgi:hypothetical protein
MYKKICCDSEFVFGVALDFFEGECKNSKECLKVRKSFVRDHLDYSRDSGYSALVKCCKGKLPKIWQKFTKSVSKNKDIKKHFTTFVLGFKSLEYMELAIKIFNDMNLSFPILSDAEYQTFECTDIENE